MERARMYIRSLQVFVLSTAVWIAFSSPVAMAEDVIEFSTDSEGKVCRVIPYAGYTITKPGRYCLTHDLLVQWKGGSLNARIPPAILLRSSNVVLDLNGFTIGYRQHNPLVSENGGAGIDQSNDILNAVVIRNGTVEKFSQGIQLPLYSQAILEGIQERWLKTNPGAFAHPQQDILIENIVFQDNKIDAYLFGRDLVLRGNKFFHSGLSNRQRENWGGNPIGQPKSYAAVIIHGANVLIEDNRFELNGPVRGLPFTFLYLYDGDGATVSGNSFVSRATQTAPTYGIALRNTTKHTFKENTFKGLDEDVFQLRSF